MSQSDILLDWSEALSDGAITLDEYTRQRNQEIRRLARVERELEKETLERRIMSANKDVKQILTRLEKLGYVIRYGGPDNKVGLVAPDGEVVRLPLGQPLTIHLTPGSSESIDGLYNTLKKCGINLEQEEKEMGESNKQEMGLNKFRNDRKVRSHTLREKLKQLMLDHDLRQTDVYHFAEDYASTHGIVAPGNPQTFISGFLRGTDVTDKYFEFVDRTVKAIDERNGKIQRQSRKHVRTEPLTSEPLPPPKPVPVPEPKLPVVKLTVAEELVGRMVTPIQVHPHRILLETEDGTSTGEYYVIEFDDESTRLIYYKLVPQEMD